MLDMARRRAYPTSPDELPEWLTNLAGAEVLLPAMVDAAPPGSTGDWNVALTVPADPAGAADVLDPLVLLAALAYGMARIEDKMTDLVAVCRQRGASWTQVGHVLGMTKQAAWERFSGED